MRVFVVCAMCNDYTSHTNSGAATVSQSMFCVTRAAAARALSFCDAVTRNDADAERERVEVHSIKKHTHSLRSRLHSSPHRASLARFIHSLYALCRSLHVRVCGLEITSESDYTAAIMQLKLCGGGSGDLNDLCVLSYIHIACVLY